MVYRKNHLRPIKMYTIVYLFLFIKWVASIRLFDLFPALLFILVKNKFRFSPTHTHCTHRTHTAANIQREKFSKSRQLSMCGCASLWLCMSVGAVCVALTRSYLINVAAGEAPFSPTPTHTLPPTHPPTISSQVLYVCVCANGI